MRKTGYSNIYVYFCVFEIALSVMNAFMTMGDHIKNRVSLNRFTVSHRSGRHFLIHSLPEQIEGINKLKIVFC